MTKRSEEAKQPQIQRMKETRAKKRTLRNAQAASSTEVVNHFD